MASWPKSLGKGKAAGHVSDPNPQTSLGAQGLAAVSSGCCPLTARITWAPPVPPFSVWGGVGGMRILGRSLPALALGCLLRQDKGSP